MFTNNIMSKYGLIQSKLGTPGAMAIQADSLPLAIADESDRPGWKYVKDMSSNPTDKFNWYFYSGAYESLECKDIKSIFMCGCIDKWEGQTSQAPFLVLYTKMKGDGTDAGAWYHSRHAWTLHNGSQLVRAGERCLFYCLDEPRDDYDGARKVKFNNRVDTGIWDDSNEVLTCSLQSDSGAVSMECLVKNMGMDCLSFNRLPESTINLRCVR